METARPNASFCATRFYEFDESLLVAIDIFAACSQCQRSMGLSRDSEAVLVPADVLRSIRRAQAPDGVNEYSVNQVISSAERLGEKDALHWIAKHPEVYFHGVINGFVEG